MASSPRSPVLELERVRKRFSDGTPALDGIDLEVRQGELVSVVGPSGCGKSTLLRIVAGLTMPSSGMVCLRTRRIGFVFQDPTLLPWCRLRSNLELLDELTRHRLTDELAQLLLERGFAALLVTKSVTEAVFLSSRVVVLSAQPGRVVGAFPVPFPYPRAPRLRHSGAFDRLAGEVSACLRAVGQCPAEVELGGGCSPSGARRSGGSGASSAAATRSASW